MGSQQSFPSSSPTPGNSSSDIVEGTQIGRLIRLKPEYRDRYIALHAHPFPEVLEQIRTSNLRNYSIFLHEGFLFSFFEYVGTDFDADMEAMAENPTVQDWWTLTDPMQESLTPEDSEEWWVPMDELYHGGTKTRPSADTEKKAYVGLLREESVPEVPEVYAEIAPKLDDAIESANIQNYGVYRWKNRLYMYFECTGDHPRSDVDRLHDSNAMQALREKLAPLSKKGSAPPDTYQNPMESVFYTP